MAVPGVEHVKKEPYDERDILLNVLETVDNRVDDLIGLRPLRHIVVRPLTSIAPANVIRNITGMKKPSELVESMEDRLEGDLGAKKMGAIPKPPGLPGLAF